MPGVPERGMGMNNSVKTWETRVRRVQSQNFGKESRAILGGSNTHLTLGAIVARPISFSVPYERIGLSRARAEEVCAAIGSSTCSDAEAFTWTEDHEHCIVIHAATQDDMLFARMMIPLW